MNKKVMLSLLLISCLCSCGNTISGEWKMVVASKNNIVTQFNTNVEPFNTVMQLSYFLNDENAATNEKTFNEVSKIYNETIENLHRKFDRHYYYKINESSIEVNVKTINDSFGTNEEIYCSDELYELLKLGVKYYELTNGQFNIFTGSLTDYWEEIFARVYNYESLGDVDPYFNESQKEKLESLVDSIPSNIDEFNQQITFNDDKKTVIFNNCNFNNGQKVKISVGGIAKGLATDIVKNKLVENGYKDGYLLSGGSSITTLSTPIFTSKQKGHKISVINPAKSNIIEKEVALSMKFTEEFSFSTSGNYTTNKNYSFVKDGNIVYRHHIINPFTGYPESHYRSVSIMTNYFSNADVDAMSTAFMNLSIKDGLKLRQEILNKYEGSNLELFYLCQEGKDSEAKVTVHATSDMNGSLSVAKGVKLVYEE